MLPDGRDGQAENGPDVQGELGQVLGDEGDIPVSITTPTWC